MRINKERKSLEKSLEKEVLQIEALADFYFKNDENKGKFFNNAVDYFFKTYEFFNGIMPPEEAKRESLFVVSNKILQEVNIYYGNRKR